MKRIVQIGVLLSALLLMGAVALAEKEGKAWENDDVECAIDTDCGEGEVCLEGECEEVEVEENETDDEKGNTSQKGKPEDAGKLETNDSKKPEDAGEGELGNQTQKGKPEDSGKLETNETKLTGIQRAIQNIMRAQERLAAAGKEAPGHEVALRVLNMAMNKTDEANDTDDNKTAEKLAREASKLAKKAEVMNQGELEQLENEFQEREKIKNKKGQLGDTNVTDEEVEEEIDDELGDGEGQKLMKQIKAMSKEFKAMVKETLKNGSDEEKLQLANQLRAMVEENVQAAEGVQETKRNQIRKMLEEGETAEEIAAEAV